MNQIKMIEMEPNMKINEIPTLGFDTVLLLFYCNFCVSKNPFLIRFSRYLGVCTRIESFLLSSRCLCHSLSLSRFRSPSCYFNLILLIWIKRYITIESFSIYLLSLSLSLSLLLFLLLHFNNKKMAKIWRYFCHALAKCFLKIFITQLLKMPTWSGTNIPENLNLTPLVPSICFKKFNFPFNLLKTTFLETFFEEYKMLWTRIWRGWVSWECLGKMSTVWKIQFSRQLNLLKCVPRAFNFWNQSDGE